LLRQKSITQVGGPLNILRELFDQIGEGRHGLNTGIPILLLHGVDEGLIFQSLVLHQPLLKLDDF
jgi:hypothetical protein